MIGQETIGAGASHVCPTCKKAMMDEVCQSAAGFYIGTMCNCGPYSRESDYYRSKEDAQAALEAGDYGRTHDFRGGGAGRLEVIAIESEQTINDWGAAVRQALARKAALEEEN